MDRPATFEYDARNFVERLSTWSCAQSPTLFVISAPWQDRAAMMPSIA